jgi:hypothetical protein
LIRRVGLGLAVGISSGANLLAALMVQERMGADACVVTVFPDDNKKYLTQTSCAPSLYKTATSRPKSNSSAIKPSSASATRALNSIEEPAGRLRKRRGGVRNFYAARRFRGQSDYLSCSSSP